MAADPRLTKGKLGVKVKAELRTVPEAYNVTVEGLLDKLTYG